MAKLENVERIEKVMFQVGANFTVKNSVSTGTKGKDNVKLHPIYARNYNSTKYSDKSSLEAINIRTSDFLVFAFNDFQNRKNEEIYISYPHMVGLLNTIEQAVAMVNTPDMFTGNGVNPKYSDVVLKTPPLGGQKTIAIIPHVIQHDQNTVRGVMMFLNTEDTYVEVDINNLNTLHYILNKFDLYASSATLLLTGLLYDGAGVGADSTPSFSGGGNNNTTSFGGGGANRPARGIFGGGAGKGASGNGNAGGGSRGGFTAPTKSTNLNDLDKIVEGEDVSVPSDADVPFTGGETSDSKGGSGSPLSLNNIMDTAKEIEVPDLEDGDGDLNF
jgi:hypothetical protein